MNFDLNNTNTTPTQTLSQIQLEKYSSTHPIIKTIADNTICEKSLLDTGALTYCCMNRAMVNKIINNKDNDNIVETIKDKLIVNGYDGKQSTIEEAMNIKSFTLILKSVERKLENVKFLIINTISEIPEIIISQKLIQERLGFNIIEELEKHLKSSNDDTKHNTDQNGQEDDSNESQDYEEVERRIISRTKATTTPETVKHDDANDRSHEGSEEIYKPKQLITIVNNRQVDKDAVEVRIEKDAYLIVLPNISISIKEDRQTQKTESRITKPEVALDKTLTEGEVITSIDATIDEIEQAEMTEEMKGLWPVVSEGVLDEPRSDMLAKKEEIGKMEYFLYRNSVYNDKSSNLIVEQNNTDHSINRIDNANFQRSDRIKRRVEKKSHELYYGEGDDIEDPVSEFSLFGKEMSDEKLKEIVDGKIHESTTTLNLSAEQTAELQKLVYEYTFEKRILRTKLGADMEAKFPPYKLNLKKGAVPKKLNHYPMSTEAERQLLMYVKELLEINFVRDDDLDLVWCSATQMVYQTPPKPMRLTVDLRYVNSQSETIQGIMIPVAEKLMKIRNLRYLVIIDFNKGFWQLKLHPDSQKYFAFSTPFGTYIPTRLPQGAADSPLWFHLNIQKMLRDIIEEYKLVLWIDDNMIWAETWEEMMTLLKKFFEKCYEFGLQININKTTLPTNNAIFCGYRVTDTGYTMVSKNYDSMLKIPEPITGGDLGAFLFMYNWIRNNFVPDLKLLGKEKGEFAKATFASLSAPLWEVMQRIYDIMGSNKKSKYKNFLLAKAGWNEEHKSLIELLKEKLAKMIQTSWRKPGTKLCLLTDASELFWSYVITQVAKWDDEKQVHEQDHEILVIRSGPFNGHMLGWDIQSKEAYAIAKACMDQEHILYDPIGFSVWGDNNNLVRILDPDGSHPLPNKPTRQRLSNWLGAIAQYKINEFLNIRGDDNHIPDAFTRNLADKNQLEREIPEGILLNNNHTISGLTGMLTGDIIRTDRRQTYVLENDRNQSSKPSYISEDIKVITRARRRKLASGTSVNEGEGESDEDTAEAETPKPKKRRRVEIDRTKITNEMLKLFYDYDTDGCYKMPDVELIKAAQKNRSDAMKAFMKQHIKRFTRETIHNMLCLDKKYWIPHDNIELQVRIALIAHIGLDPNHLLHGHRNISDTITEIKKYFEWHGLPEFVKQFCMSCLHCIKTKDKNDVVPRIMGNKEPSKRLEEITADYLYIGPTKITTNEGTVEQEYKYILVIKDVYSRYTRLFPATTTNAEIMAEALIEWIHLFKSPSILRTDSATHFMNRVASVLENTYGYKQKFTIPYSAWTNGSVERVMPEVIKLIKLVCKNNLGTWPNYLDQISGILNDTKSKTLGGLTPKQILMAINPEEDFKGVIYDVLTKTVEPAYIDTGSRNFKAQLGRLITELERNSTIADKAITLRRLENQRSKVKDSAIILRARELNKSPESITPEDLIPRFAPGDYVNVARAAQPKDHKLMQRWEGPCKVIGPKNEYTYICENIITGEQTIHHAQRMKFYCDKDLDTEIAELKNEIRREQYFQGGRVVELIQNLRKNEVDIWEVLIKWEGFPLAESEWRTVNDIMSIKRHAEILLDWLERNAIMHPEQPNYRIVLNKLTKNQ